MIHGGTPPHTGVCEKKGPIGSYRGPVGLHFDKDKAGLTKIKTFMKLVKSCATDLRIIDSKCYALKHGNIENAIVDKDRPSLINNKNRKLQT